MTGGTSNPTSTAKNPTNTGGTTSVPSSSLTNDQNNFETGWQSYINASKGAYDIETSRAIDQYTQQQQAYDLQQTRNREDYARYTSDQQSATNKQLASSSKDFARKLSAAGNAYGQRGLLRSGIAKSQLGDATNTFGDEQTYFKTQSQRQLEAGQLGYDRQYADITTAENNLATKKSQYAGDREVGKTILENTLQYQGDTQYNTQQSQQWATEQDRLRQEAKNKAAGVTTAPALRTWRRGGIYTAS